MIHVTINIAAQLGSVMDPRGPPGDASTRTPTFGDALVLENGHCHLGELLAFEKNRGWYQNWRQKMEISHDLTINDEQRGFKQL